MAGERKRAMRKGCFLTERTQRFVAHKGLTSRRCARTGAFLMPNERKLKPKKAFCVASSRSWGAEFALAPEPDEGLDDLPICPSRHSKSATGGDWLRARRPGSPNVMARSNRDIGRADPAGAGSAFPRWAGMPALRCFEIDCHSERSEESRPDPSPAIPQTQSEIPRFARNDISWFPGARQQMGMSDCHENAVGAALVAAQGAHKGRPYTVLRIFVPGGEPRAHGICAQGRLQRSALHSKWDTPAGTGSSDVAVKPLARCGTASYTTAARGFEDLKEGSWH